MQAAIVGIGQTEFAKNIGRSEREILCEAVIAALKDAQLTPADVDGVVSMTMDATDEVEIARNLGLGDLSFFTRVGGGGGGGSAMVGMAALAVMSGQAETVVVYRARNRGSGARPWRGGLLNEYQAWTRPSGLIRPVDEVALWSRRFMAERGISREQLASIAMTFREHAHTVPGALMRGRQMTLDDYFSARWVSEPLSLFDCSLETDGAVALVVTSSARARDLPNAGVIVDSFAQGINQDYQLMMNLHAEDPIGYGPAHVAAKKLWATSSVGPDEIDVAQVYDVFSPVVLATLEAYGLGDATDLGGFVAEGGLRFKGGALPTNTTGGSLSEAYVHGMNLIIEGVRQIRGTAVNQVSGARACFVSSAACSSTSSLILVRE